MPSFVVTLQCNDGPGIVRAASTAIGELGGNILENDQFSDPMTNQFCMRTRFETPIDDVDRVRVTLSNELARFSPTLSVRPEEVRRRALVMVSKYDHCLADLLYHREQGDLSLDIVAVVSNHPDCRDLATRHGIPFHEVGVTAATRARAEQQLLSFIDDYGVDFVVLARYMQVLAGACARNSPAG